MVSWLKFTKVYVSSNHTESLSLDTVSNEMQTVFQSNMYKRENSMKSTIKTMATALAISVVTVSVASAMIPKDDLEKNLFPDQGISNQILSDIDSGKIIIHDDVPGLSFGDESPEPLTQYPQQLVGKFII